MTKSVQKIALSTSRDIPFDKLVLAQSNVRHVKARVGIEQLAEDIARRTLLQSLTVRAVIGDDGAETGIYEVPAGGRRFRALELLVKQKRLPKTAPIPCVIREFGMAEEDSLAENVQRAPLHPLDQFRAFLAMREQGMGEEEIAASFFVTPAVVKQRLKLASVSPALLDVYAEDDMTLEQLMAFTVSCDHERQDAVWEAIQRSYSREPYAIRRMLTEGAVRASDKRAMFVGLEAYEEAGGTILRDLFQADDGGWLQDPGLLDMLVAERLREEAEAVRAEGWRWVDAAPDFAYGHTYGLRGLVGERHELTADEEAAREVIVSEYVEIEAAHAGGADLPDEVDARLGEIETALETYDNRPAVYRPEDLAIAGAFVSIDGSGKLRVERGYVRPEDEVPVAQLLDDGAGSGDGGGDPQDGDGEHDRVDASGTGIGAGATEPEEDEGLKPLPDRLLTELTACRTVALREAIGRSPEVAFTAALHALCLKLFYHYAQDSCVELDIKSVSFGTGVPGLNDSVAATTIDARHREYAERLPREPGDLWDALVSFGDDDRESLFAHCIAHGINAVHEAYNRRPRALAHADRLATAVDLDMAQAWTPTAENFIGRVTKARIVEAVREARGDAVADRLTGMKKPDMVAAAEVQLAGTGWLPEPLRTPGRPFAPAEGVPFVDETAAIEAIDTVSTDIVEESAAIDGEQAISFQRSARFRGPDLDSATPTELVSVTARLNAALRRLGSGWAVYVEAQRSAAGHYPLSEFPDPVSALVDRERRAQFEEEGAHFESGYFLTLAWLPPPDGAARAEGWLYEGGARGSRDDNWRERLKSFVDRTDRVLDLLDGFVPEAAWLSDAETLTYLHSTISSRRQRIAVPATPMHLDALPADEPLTGGLAPMLGNQHLRTLSIIGLPGATEPGILDELNRLPFAYRWSTRAICLDKADAAKLLGRIRRQWFAKRKSVAAILKEVLTNEASVLVDNDASNKAADADEALQLLGADVAGWAYVTATITVSHGDPRIADARLKAVEKIVQGRDFTCIPESLNALEAWLGSLPGHAYANVRQPPISTLNLAHMIPLSAVWAGPEANEHLAGPPLFFARTEGSTPFRFSSHVGDVGHTLVVGPTGAGKSVLLAFMALQFRRYPQAQVFAFDFGGSIRAATLAMGGDWHDLGGGLADNDGALSAAPSLQPLARIDEPGERAWAAEWLAGVLTREGVAVGPEIKELLWSALASLASAPVFERTLTGLTVLLQSSVLKQALQPYTLDGPWGLLLDGDHEALGSGSVQAFETEGLVGTAAAAAVLAYLFHRIGDRLTGAPSMIIVDEGWLALDDAEFGQQLREWLKTLRKKNASVVFATQSLADIDGSAIAPAIIESCPTRLFLPNERALEPQIAAIYRRFGLNDRQLEIVARATPKRDYYCQSRRGNRLFELGLSDVALAFTAASSRADQIAVERLFAEHGPEGFAAAWLRQRGLGWAAELLPAAGIPVTTDQEILS